MIGYARSHWFGQVCWACFVYFCSAIATLSTSTTIDASEAAQGPPTPSYRRVFVPADKPESWPVDGERFLPVSQEEFERLVDHQSSNASTTQQAPAHISSAIYEAKIAAGKGLSGTASLTVELPNKASQLVQLAPLNLIVQSAHWRNRQGVPAVLGYWQQRNQPSILAVQADDSDVLEFDWQLAATRVDTSGTNYLLQLPTAVPQTFVLNLPDDHTASIQGGELLHVTPITPGTSRWEFQLAPRESHQLRIKQQIPTLIEQPNPLVSQSTSYQVNATGLEILTQLRLDARKQPVSQLRAEISGDMRVVNVAIDNQPAEWRIQQDEAHTWLVITRPLSQVPQAIAINCLTKIRTNTPWKLPKLYFENVAWTEGTMRLLISPDMQLRSLSPQLSALQNIVGIAETALNDEVFRLQEWAPEAAIVVQVGRSLPDLKIQLATSVDLDRDEATASVAAEISNAGGNIFRLQAEVATDWTIDSVTTTPSAALNEWHTSHGAASTSLALQLNQPITMTKPLRVNIKLRKASDQPVLPATVGDLQLVRFLQADHSRNLLQLRYQEARQLVLSERINNASLALADLAQPLRNLLVESTLGTVIDVTNIREDETVEYRQQVAQYDAEVAYEAAVLPSSLQQRYLIDVHLLSGSLSQVEIESDESLPEDLQWTLVGQRGTVAMVRRDTEKARNNSESAARYALQLPVSMSADFRLIANYSAPALPTERCNLIRLPAAVDWHGHALLRGDLGSFVVLDQDWTPTVSPLGPAEVDGKPIIGCYQLGRELARRELNSSGLRLRRLATSKAAPRLIAWLAEYRTLLAANGTALHNASYSLENLGVGDVEMQLPVGAELQGVWLDNQQLEPKQILLDEQTVRFQLADENRWPYLSLQYTTQMPPLAGSATVRPQIPQSVFPIQVSRWTLWAPEQYEIDHSVTDYSARRNHWWKRLFGPLARSRDEKVFNPAATTSWSELWATPLVGQQTRNTAEQIASLLANSLQSHHDQSFGQIFAEIPTPNQFESLLFIDQSALLARGIQTDTPRSILVSDQQNARMLTTLPLPLSSYRLALLTTTDKIILTTAERVAHWHDLLRPTETPGVFLVNSDGLAESLDLLPGLGSADIVPYSFWLTAPTTKSPPWQNATLSTLDDVGRQAQTIEFLDALPAIVVRRAYVQQSLWYVVLLLSMVVGIWQLAHYPNAMIVVTAVVGAACLVAPTRWLTIPQAMLLGLLAAAIVRVAIKTDQYRIERRQLPQQLTHILTLLLIGKLVVGDGTLVSAQTPVHDPIQSTTQQSIQRVLMPIDSQGRRQGDDVYLPAEFLQALRSRAADTSSPATQCVLLEAKYLGDLRTNGVVTAAPNGNRVAGNWSLLLKVETFLPNCRLQLPLQRSDALWQDAEHRLDGLPVKLNWQAAEDACTVNLPTTGVHWLRLAFQPKIVDEAGLSVLQLHVPKLPRASLELNIGESVDGLQVQGAVAQYSSEADTTRLYSLGSRDKIVLQWSPRITQASTANWTRLDQYSWLHVESLSSYLDVQLAITGYQSNATTLELELSPQLQIIPPEPDTPVARIVPVTESTSNRVRLEFQSDLPEDFVIPLRFELQRSSSFGQFNLPEVRVVGSLPTQNLFAVSVAAGLSPYEEKTNNTARRIEPSEFAAAWESLSEQPLFAYALGAEAPNWLLQVRPDPLSFTAQQSLRVHCQANSIRTEFEAIVADQTRECLSHHIAIPTDLHIDDISIQSQNESTLIPIRWARVSPGEAVVFLSRPLLDTHSVNLQGHLNTKTNSLIDVPQVRLLGAMPGEIHMDLYRTDDLQVAWDNPQSAAQEISSQRVNSSDNSIHVGHFFWRTSAAGSLSLLRIQRNDPQFEERTVTMLQRKPEGWSARLSSRLNVRQGVITRLVLETPESFQAPYVITPEAVGKVGTIRKTANGNEVAVLLTRPAAAGDEIELQITGKLPQTTNQRLIAPSMRWKGASQREQHVLLPTADQGNTISWQISGLTRQMSLSPDWLPFLTGDSRSFVYRVDQDFFTAEQRLSRGTMNNARVRCATLDGVLSPDGVFTTTAELILQLGRATSCKVQLPADAEFYQLVVGDQPARREQLADGTWKLPLGPPYMPSRILVSYRTRAPRVGQSMRLDPPKILLGDQVLPMLQAWWRIRTTGNMQLHSPSRGRQVGEAEFAQNYHKRAEAVMQEALSRVSELPAGDRRAWNHTWEKIELYTRNQFLRLPQAASEKIDFDSADTRSQPSAIADDPPPTEVTDSMSLTYPPALPQHNDSSPICTDSFFVTERGDPLVFATSAAQPRQLWHWFAAATLICGVTALVMQLKHRRQWHHQICRWPHTLALVGGATWWLLLKPSALGMLIIVLALTSLTIKQLQTLRRQFRQTKTVRLTLPTS